jgi:hypothetical protein
LSGGLFGDEVAAIQSAERHVAGDLAPSRFHLVLRVLAEPPKREQGTRDLATCRHIDFVVFSVRGPAGAVFAAATTEKPLPAIFRGYFRAWVALGVLALVAFLLIFYLMVAKPAYDRSMSPQLVLVLYVVVPLWLAAGFADWVCHRRSAIDSTSGPPESALHLLMLAETGIPLLAALYLEVNALILLLLAVAFVSHEITAYADVRYAASRRHVSVAEQFVHSILEMAPLIVLLLFASAHWDQPLAVLWVSDQPAQFGVTRGSQPPPLPYTVVLVLAIVLLSAGPYIEELVRTIRARAPAVARRPSG